MSDFYWPDVSYFQAKFGWETVKASKVILNYSKLSRFDKPFGGGLAPPCISRGWFDSATLRLLPSDSFSSLSTSCSL